jgi:hypothetical protein
LKNCPKSLHYEAEFYGHFQKSILEKGKIFSQAKQNQLVGHIQPTFYQLDSPDIDG